MINFVALDLETANAYRGSICQIGITEVIDEKGTFYKNPDNQQDIMNYYK